MSLFRKVKPYYPEDIEDDDMPEGVSLQPPQQMDVFDWLIAALLAAGSAVFAWCLSYRGLHPDAWADCAVAAGLRPATTIFPGFWRVIAGWIYKTAGVAGGDAAIALLGKVVLGLLTGLAYLIFKETLSVLVRLVEERTVWHRGLSRFVCIVSALLFLCADPVWTLGYAFTPVSLSVLLFTLGVFLLSRFLGTGTVRPVYWAMFVMGLFCAESPLGLIATLGFWLIFYVLLTKGGVFHVQLLQPLIQQSSKWYLTFFWAVGVLAGVAVDVLGFMSFGGLEANGFTAGSIPLKYVVQMWHAISGAAAPGGWIVGFGFAALPFIIGIALLRRATDLEYFLSYHVGIVFFSIGCVAYTQLASLRPLWFWVLSDATSVHSRLLLYLCSLMSAGTVLCTLAVVAVDAYCRDHRRLAAQMDPDLDEAPARSRTFGIVRTFSFAFVMLMLVAGAVPGRFQKRTLEMLSLMDDYVREVVTEAGDAKWLFTDGSFDCALELESARRGGDIKCISLLPGPNVRPMLSLRALMSDDEDRLSAEVGGSNLLTTWQRDKPARINASAVQIGLEIWRNKRGRSYPPTSGTLARTVWALPEGAGDAERTMKPGIARARALAERMLAIYADGGPSKLAGRWVNDLFLFMQWRLARLARVRAELADAAGDVAAALAELRYADTLDDKNESLKRILAGMTRSKEHTMRQMTPREGLRYALVRADFMLARSYAEPILDADPDDIDANFGMGMSYLVQDQYNRAEEFLKKCAARNPKEPAFWNNIAVAQMKLGRFAEARENAKKALELIPDSAPVKSTLDEIDAAEKEAAEAAADGSAGAAGSDGKAAKK